MALRFTEDASVIPIEIEVNGADGNKELITLKFNTDEDSLVQLIKRQEAYKENIKELNKKHPIIDRVDPENISDESADDISEYIEVAKEVLRDNYDSIFGEGTFDKLYGAGLGAAKLIPLLDQITDSLTDELSKQASKTQKESEKIKAARLIKNKKKQK